MKTIRKLLPNRGKTHEILVNQSKSLCITIKILKRRYIMQIKLKNSPIIWIGNARNEGSKHVESVTWIKYLTQTTWGRLILVHGFINFSLQLASRQKNSDEKLRQNKASHTMVVEKLTERTRESLGYTVSPWPLQTNSYMCFMNQLCFAQAHKSDNQD